MSKSRVERSLAGAAILFAALGDETRLRLLQRLANDGPASISNLADRFQLSRQGVTKHLEVLAVARIISSHREGRERIWEMQTSQLALASNHLASIAREWDGALARLKRLVETGSA